MKGESSGQAGSGASAPGRGRRLLSGWSANLIQTVLGITFIVIMICAPEGIIGTLRAILTRKDAGKERYKGN